MMLATGIGVAQLLALSMLGGNVGLPLGIPPQEGDPHIAAVAPDPCLAYLSWAGTAEPQSTSENHTELLLAEPEVQLLLVEINRQLDQAIRRWAREEGPLAENLAMPLLQRGRKMLMRPTALYVSKLAINPPQVDVQAGVVVNVGEDAAELNNLLADLRKKLFRDAATEVEIGGVMMTRVQADEPAPPVTIGLKDEYLLIGIGEGSVEGMLERWETPPPAWLSNLQTQLKVPRQSLIVYFNSSAIRTSVDPLLDKQSWRVLKALGFDNITSGAYVAGLDKRGYLVRGLAALDGQPAGLLAPAAGKPLSPADLKPIPRDSLIAVAARFDADKFLETLLRSAVQIDPRLLLQIERELEHVDRQFQINVRDEVLQPLGDVWCLYHSPGEGGLLAGFAAVIRVQDRARLARTEQKLLAIARAAEESARQQRRALHVGHVEFAGHDIYYLSALDDNFPLSPAWCLTDTELVIGLFPQTIKAYLSRGDEYRSIAEAPEVAALFDSGTAPFKLGYFDSPALFDLAYPFVQIFAKAFTDEMRKDGLDVDISILPSGQSIRKHLRPHVISVAHSEKGIEIISRQSLPMTGTAVAAAAAAAVAAQGRGGPGFGAMLVPSKARQVQSSNNLKMIALAMHNYHDTFRKLPAAYTADSDGQPLLSWRVQILPFLDQQALYDQFHLDEPWDSEHNKQLIPLMPNVYAAPGSTVEAGKTNYLTVRGKNTVFPGEESLGFHSITDGTSLTIMTVEANDQRAVIWTKPDDFEYDVAKPQAGLVGLRANGFLAGLADGSVRFVKASIDSNILNALFTRNDGQVIDMSALER